MVSVLVAEIEVLESRASPSTTIPVSNDVFTMVDTTRAV